MAWQALLPFLPQIAGSVVGALGGALGRRSQERKSQFELDLGMQRERNAFLARNPSYAQEAVARRRYLGYLPQSFVTQTRGVPGVPETTRTSRILDPETLLRNITAGKFGEDLRGTTVASIKQPDFRAPKVAGRGMFGSFLEDLLKGAGTGLTQWRPDGKKGGINWDLLGASPYGLSDYEIDDPEYQPEFIDSPMQSYSSVHGRPIPTGAARR
tara:strand:- start:101 stop:739 length:639 start_codon:yes stop_codon:yes gene_type:complete